MHAKAGTTSRTTKHTICVPVDHRRQATADSLKTTRKEIYVGGKTILALDNTVKNQILTIFTVVVVGLFQKWQKLFGWIRRRTDAKRRVKTCIGTVNSCRVRSGSELRVCGQLRVGGPYTLSQTR